MDSELVTFFNVYGKIQSFELPCWTDPSAEGVIDKPGDPGLFYISTGRAPKRKEENVNGRSVVKPTMRRGETPVAAFPALRKGVSGAASSPNQKDNVLFAVLFLNPAHL
jgi:hypothetical protein